MPGPVSDSHHGPGDSTPYVPSWCYPQPQGPKLCPCGHHEGYHNDAGVCLLVAECRCAGLPAESHTSDADFYADHRAGSGSRPDATPFPDPAMPALRPAGAASHKPETACD